MKDVSLPYRVGKFLGKHVWWCVAAISVLIWWLWPVGNAQVSNTAAADIAAGDAQKKAAEADRIHQGCLDSQEKRRGEYAQQTKLGKHWEAALALHPCNKHLKQSDFPELVKAAEIKALVAEIKAPGKRANELSASFNQLSRDYPEVALAYAKLAETQISAAKVRDALILKKEQEAAKKYKRSQGVSIGMTQEDVLASAWGRPERVNRTTTAKGTREQWVYGLRNYLYFEDGVLVSIQN